jgi:pimeloyl-ACP methyl ester carboxylesterase
VSAGDAPWVLLRGLTREARHWGSFAEQLGGARQPPVITLDLPGNGAFNGLRSPTTVRGMTDFVRAQLQAMGHAPPYRLLAMSLGGMVATDWAQTWPQDVARLVLINTSMRPFSRVTQRLRPANWPQLALLAARWQDADYAERVIHTLTCNRLDTQATDLADWAQIRKTTPVAEANAQRQLWAAARFTCAPQRPSCPVLLLSSASDHLVHPHCSKRLATAWQTPHHQHPWAGHDLPHDDAAWVVQRVAEATL